MTNIGVEIELKDEGCFLKIKETLTRMGIEQTSTRSLYQSCHILFKRNKYYIVHFKEMFVLDGKQVTFDNEDLERRDVIAKLLEDWNLLNIVDPNFSVKERNKSLVAIIPFREKRDWNLVAKYRIGKK